MSDLFGAYRLEERVGRGGFSEVWRATDRRDDTAVAVKVLSSRRSTGDPNFQAALREEARAVAALDHPGIVHLYDQGLSDVDRPPYGSPCLVMEFADRGSLEGWTPGSWAELRGLLLRLLDALAHAHAHGVLHLDLKPANILLCGADQPRPGAKLADFGATSRLMAVDDSQLLGTPRYMSPEQVGGRPQVFGPWSDLYALGAVAFRLCTGQHAVPGASLYQLVYAHQEGRRAVFEPRLDVPDGVGRWIAWLMAPDWRDRPPRAAEARRALLQLGGALEPSPRDPILPRTRSARGLVGLRPTPLIGRGDECARLAGWLDASERQAAPSCVVLEGVAGVGKSRLAAWIASRQDERGAASPLHVAHGLGGRGGLGDALLEALGLDLGAPDEEVLAERCGFDEDDVDGALQSLGRRPSRFASPSARWAMWLRLLGKLGRGRPTLLVLEDAHNSMEALDFARWLIELRGRSPAAIRVVLTAQTEALSERAPERELLAGLLTVDGVWRIVVGPLTPDQRLPFLQALLPLEGEAAARVLERAGGNPLHAEQLVATWVEDGTLLPGPQGFRLAGQPAAAVSDHTALSQARLARIALTLTSEQRRALEAAAVLGDPCDGLEWTALCDRLGVVPDAGLEQLARAGLISGGQRRFSFANGSVREAALIGAAASGRLRGLHDAVAESLMADVSPDLARLGRHLLAAGRAEEAAGVLLNAAELACERSEHRTSSVLLDEQAAAADAARLPPDSPARAMACALRAAAVRGQARFEEATEWADRARALATSCGDPAALARAHLETGWCAVNTGRHNQAAESLEQARSLSLLAGDPAGAARATRLLGIARQYLGDLDEADRLAADAQVQWTALDRPIRAGWCALLRSQVAKQRGDLGAVERWLREAQEAFLQDGGAAGLAGVNNGLGELLRLQGRFTEAEVAYRAALAWCRATASSDGVITEANLGLLLLEAGGGREAAELLEGARATFAQQKRIELAAVMGLALAACAGRDGTREGWASRWQPAADAIAKTSFTYFEVARIAEVAADAAEHRGWTDERIAALQLALRQWERLDRSPDAARVRSQLSAIERSGDG
jgi:tetratricopeptide (TPR) repeat protein